jgi:NCS1 family nucleobase:cation symporter-1
MGVVLFGSTTAAAYSWFIGAGVAFALHWVISRSRTGRTPEPAADAA